MGPQETEQQRGEGRFAHVCTFHGSGHLSWNSCCWRNYHAAEWEKADRDESAMSRGHDHGHPTWSKTTKKYFPDCQASGLRPRAAEAVHLSRELHL